MIVSPTQDGWRCVTQPDHATLSREILALWREEGFPDHPRRQVLLEAAVEHDNGWREADAAPRLNTARARPHDFKSQPIADRLEIWARGIERHRSERPYLAALILEHARVLHRSRRQAEEWVDFLSRLDSLRPQLLEEAGMTGETLEDDYRWLHLADLLSLTVCAEWTEPFERYGVSGRFDGETLRLHPFPLAGTTSFSVACRQLKQGDWRSDAELALALAHCRWRRCTFKIAPADTS